MHLVVHTQYLFPYIIHFDDYITLVLTNTIGNSLYTYNPKLSISDLFANKYKIKRKQGYPFADQRNAIPRKSPMSCSHEPTQHRLSSCPLN